MPNYLLAGVENYDGYIELVQSMIMDTNVNYYDFNLCKEEYFSSTSEMFKDADHMNSYGAETFSRLFADFINGKISEGELFYNSYREKLQNIEPTVFGVSYHDSQDGKGEQVRNCKIVTTEHNNLECEIVISPVGGEPYKVQEFCANRFFTIMQDEQGLITITYRLSGFPDTVKTVNISY